VKLTVVQPIKKPSEFYVHRSFMALFGRALLWSLTWACLIKHTLKSYFFKIHFNIILLHIRLPSDLFPLGFLIKTMYSILPQRPFKSELLFVTC
jgi:hypothetical protein